LGRLAAAAGEHRQADRLHRQVVAELPQVRVVRLHRQVVAELPQVRVVRLYRQVVAVLRLLRSKVAQ
jgi:hypothetical protein